MGSGWLTGGKSELGNADRMLAAFSAAFIEKESRSAVRSGFPGLIIIYFVSVKN